MIRDYKAGYLSARTGFTEEQGFRTLDEAVDFLAEVVRKGQGFITLGHGFIEQPNSHILTDSELYGWVLLRNGAKIKHRGNHALPGPRNVLCQACVMGVEYKEGDELR